MSFTEGEHTFDEEILISGEEIRSYTAGEDLTGGEPVGISGNNQVSSSSADGGDFDGVVTYSVTSGEEVAIAGDDCEVRIEVSEAVTAGDELIPDGLGTFETVATSGASSGVAKAQEDIASGETGSAYIFAVQGTTA